MARKPKNFTKPVTKLPFEIQLDFMIGKSEKYKKDKKVLKTLKEENKIIKNEHKSEDDDK